MEGLLKVSGEGSLRLPGGGHGDVVTRRRGDLETWRLRARAALACAWMCSQTMVSDWSPDCVVRGSDLIGFKTFWNCSPPFRDFSLDGTNQLAPYQSPRAWAKGVARLRTQLVSPHRKLAPSLTSPRFRNGFISCAGYTWNYWAEGR